MPQALVEGIIFGCGLWATLMIFFVVFVPHRWAIPDIQVQVSYLAWLVSLCGSVSYFYHG